MQITTIGLDIAKNVFQFHGIDAARRLLFGATPAQAKCWRLQSLPRGPSRASTFSIRLETPCCAPCRTQRSTFSGIRRCRSLLAVRQISRPTGCPGQLRVWRDIGCVKRVAGSYRYYLTRLGREPPSPQPAPNPKPPSIPARRPNLCKKCQSQVISD